MKIFFLLLAVQCSLAKAALASNRTAIDTAIESVIVKGLFRDPQWLRLVHYKPRGFFRSLIRSEYRSEADGPNMFLSPDGKNDPAAELRATLLALTAPVGNETEHAQCMFPARRHWAFKKLGWDKVMKANHVPVLTCEARRAWKSQLDAEGLSLVFASAYLGNAGSMFGHTFLKIHSRGNKSGKDLLDYGISYAADTSADGAGTYAIRGIFGFYPGHFTMQPFHESLKSYANLEGRDLIEYRLRFSQEELDLFIDHLFELERTYFDYYFLTENCAYFLLEALEAAKPDLDLSEKFWYQVIPADSVRVVASIPGLVASTKYRPSLMAMFRTQASRLSDDDVQFAKDVVDSKAPRDWSSASTAALDLAIDYGAVRATSDPKFDSINFKLRQERAKRGGVSTETIIKTPSRPEEGHDPARIGVIFELPTDHDGARGRLGLQFRFAYHDRLSNDAGYLKGTTLEVLRMTALNDDQDPSRLDFREIAVLDIFSAQPRDRFSQPLSWRASFGFREPLLARSLGPYLNGGLGSTLELTRFLWLTGLINGEVLSNADLETKTPAHLGPRLIATGFISEKLKLGIDYALMRSIVRSRHYDAFSTELAWSPLRNFEMRVAYSDASIEGTRKSEWSLKLYQHLLF